MLSRFSGRRLARLGATQAVYCHRQTENSLDSIIEEFKTHHYLKGDLKADIEPDFSLFLRLVEGVLREKKNLDLEIQNFLQISWKIDRLPMVILALLECALFEILYEPLTHGRIIINEYVGLTGSFFDGQDVGFVNGILDRIVRKLRPLESQPVKENLV